jgi:hypothetical protein
MQVGEHHLRKFATRIRAHRGKEVTANLSSECIDKLRRARRPAEKPTSREPKHMGCKSLETVQSLHSQCIVVEQAKKVGLDSTRER